MHTLRSKALTFFKDEDGGPTVEFVIIFPILFFFVGFILLLAFDFFWMLTMQKAVERGARMAVTVPADVTITYEDSGLGRATESYIPLVTVELNQGNGLSSFKWLDGIFSFGNAVQPSVAAAFVGENLGN